jgi:hypothetical protein
MVLEPISSGLVARWTNLVVCEVCFVKEAIDIKKRKTLNVLNWQDKKNVTKWNF